MENILPAAFFVLMALPLAAGAQSTDAVVYQLGYADELPPASPNAHEPKRAEQMAYWLNHYKWQARGVTQVQTIRGQGSHRLLVGTDAQGKLRVKASAKGIVLQGLFLSYFASGQLLDSGAFSHNLPNRAWKTWHANGSVRSVVHYDAQKLRAVQQELSAGNAKSSFHRHALHPAHATKQGLQRLISPGEAADGYLSPFKTGLMHGPAVSFFANGQLKDSGSYHYGAKDGLWIEWHDNGEKKSRGSYEKGLAMGAWVRYNRQGQMVALSEYKHGKLYTEKLYTTTL
jgi:antitoxin component YwqK of YwqJK toxin-antitoxin module